MFKTRLLSGIVLVILAIILIVTGGDVLLFSTYIISCIGMFELYRIFKIEKSLLAYFSYAALLVFYCSLRWQFLDDKMLLFMGYMIMLMFVYVLSYPKYRAKQLMASFFGLFYVGVMLSYVYQIRTLNNGLYLAFLIFLCSWGCDTCAYCVGILIGKHKMAPKLSPKKSIGRRCSRCRTSYSVILYNFKTADGNRCEGNMYFIGYSSCCRADFNGWRFVRFGNKKKL